MIEVPVYCFRCGKRLGTEKIKRGEGNAVFTLCPKCLAKIRGKL